MYYLLLRLTFAVKRFLLLCQPAAAEQTLSWSRPFGRLTIYIITILVYQAIGEWLIYLSGELLYPV